jgi:hypothetical protein
MEDRFSPGNPGSRRLISVGPRIRWSSSASFAGWPLVSIAMGPDPEKGEIRGHARGVIAIGDMATGGLAVGGIAFGVAAIGGLASGVIAVGGLSVAALALGGLAVGGLAVGGCAIGYLAVGGAAAGYFAVGGAAFGKYVVSAGRVDPAVMDFIRKWVPWIERHLPGIR